MRPEELDPATLESRQVGPITILFGYENGKYPYGNSFCIRGENQCAIIDPSLGIVARKNGLPEVDMVIHSHTHEDHIAGTHLFPDVPWYAHYEDALGLESIEGLMEIYGLPPGETYDAFLRNIESAFYFPHSGSSVGQVRKFEEGHVFDFGGVTLEVLHTPGHTRGHCCFLVRWGDSPDKRFVYLGDIELTGFGPYYGDAWSNLEDFESSMKRLETVDAQWWLTFHHKGLIEGRETFLQMLEKFAAMIGDRESRLLDYIVEARTLDEIVAHRFVYRPGQTGFLTDWTEQGSMLQHLDRLVEAGRVSHVNGRYQVNQG